MTTYTATTIAGGDRTANHSIPIASTGTRRPTTYTATTITGGGRTANRSIPVAPTRTRRPATYTATTIPVGDRNHSIPVAPSGTRRAATYTTTTKSRSEKTGTQSGKNKNGNTSRSSSRPRADANSSKEVGTHYTVLGLTRTTTADGIKKAYHKMAIKYHPDKNVGDPNAADNFRRVKDAYETLGDLQLKRNASPQQSCHHHSVAADCHHVRSLPPPSRHRVRPAATRRVEVAGFAGILQNLQRIQTTKTRAADVTTAATNRRSGTTTHQSNYAARTRARPATTITTLNVGNICREPMVRGWLG